jgi:hypothetical protein
MRRRGRLGGLSPARRAIVVFLMVAPFAIVTVAERDIQNRPDYELRGTRLAWRLLSPNALGALAYLRWGRVPAPGSSRS